MSSLHVLGEEWSLKRSLASLWARRRPAWLVWPVLLGIALYVGHMLWKAISAGAQHAHSVFMTDELSQMSYGFTVNQWGIYRSDILFRAWLFVAFMAIIVLVIIAVAYHVVMGRVQRKRVAKAEEERRELDRLKQQCFESGRRSEQSLVYTAIIHAFKPKVMLPPVPDGCQRVFYICVRLSHPGAIPTEDRRIRFSDIPNSAVFWGAIGAPHYDSVVSDQSKLIIMDAVYLLDDRPTVGFGQ
ncbi:MAG: hypothetical protein ACEQSB_05815 [Undibacterium sp.]